MRGLLGSVLLMLLLAGHSPAQNLDTGSIFVLPVQLDSITVSSSFDVGAFIRRVKSDTTFYKAFKSLRFISYTAVNDIAAYAKDGSVAGSYHSKTRQIIKDNCRHTEVLNQNASGDFYKANGDYNYYTAELFDHLFFAKDPVCDESDIVAGSLEVKGSGPMAKSEYELKQLIFNPGAKISGVPFMGDHASIFDEDEARKYDFKITQELYGNEQCYVFRITPKSDYVHKALYNELTTWFRKSDYSIVARNYSLSYHTLVYDFDVRMKVRTKQSGTKLYPTYINYDGNWHVFTKKRELVKFTMVTD